MQFSPRLALLVNKLTCLTITCEQVDENDMDPEKWRIPALLLSMKNYHICTCNRRLLCDLKGQFISIWIPRSLQPGCDSSGHPFGISEEEQALLEYQSLHSQGDV